MEINDFIVQLMEDADYIVEDEAYLQIPPDDIEMTEVEEGVWAKA